MELQRENLMLLDSIELEGSKGNGKDKITDKIGFNLESESESLNINEKAKNVV